MDTRRKIVSLEAAAGISEELHARGGKLTIVAGYFDVLTADHVRRIRALANGQPLMAAVLDPPRPILAAQARAELAAALSVIDYVVRVPESGLDRALEKIRPDEVVREETADHARSTALMEHVHRRQRT